MQAARLELGLASGGDVDRLDLAQVDSFYKFVIGQVERPLIRLALEKSNGNQSQAAKILGINRNTLRKKITELGIELPSRG